MDSTDWLLMLSRDGTVEAVDGGAPPSWLARRVDDCAGLPDGVKSAARKLVRDLAQPLAGTLLRRVRVEPEAPSAPSFTLVSIEAILIRPAEVPLAALIRRALEPLVRQAEAEGVTLQLDLPDELPHAASLDADKIAWALSAVVGNALRYVRRGDGGMPGGTIRVRAAHNVAHRMINITVQDDGPGIPASVRPWLFVPDPETGRAAGLGLRLVHDIVAAHGGGMVLKSSAEPSQRGTTVTLWLPLRD
jgi:signal transduction histidine kinase